MINFFDRFTLEQFTYKPKSKSIFYNIIIIIFIAICPILRSRLYKITKKYIKNIFFFKIILSCQKKQYLCTRFKKLIKKLIKRKEKYYEQT